MDKVRRRRPATWRDMESTESLGSGLLYGLSAIAQYLGITERQAKHLVRLGRMPAFKIGKRVCARRATLDDCLRKRESAASRSEAKGEGV